jgi:hypothetical protein
MSDRPATWRPIWNAPYELKDRMEKLGARWDGTFWWIDPARMFEAVDLVEAWESEKRRR